MAVFTTVRSGNWSDTSHTTGPWAGAETPTTKPGASDSVVVGTDGSGNGYVLTQDEDAGVLSVTINGAAAGKTPSKLTVTATAGTYTLTLSAASSILGTNLAVKGQLYAGTVGTPLPNTITWIIQLGTTGSIVGTYLDVQLFCTQPANKWVKLSADEAAAQTVLSVDTDVTGDIWAAGDVVAICDVDKALDYQRTTIATGGIAASTITVDNALDSACIAGAYLIRVTRNIRVLIGGTNYAIDCTSGGTGFTLSCEIRQTSATIQGRGVIYGIGHTISGIVSGCSYGVYYGTGHTISGTVSGCTNGVYYGSGHTISGIVSGCSYGVYYGSGRILRGAAIGGAAALANTRDVYMSAQVIGYGAGLQSTTQVADYQEASVPNGSSWCRLYDVAGADLVPNPGRTKQWTVGGICASEDWVLGTHGTPPVALVFLHKQTYESAAYHGTAEFPILARAGVPLTIYVYAKKLQNGMTLTPYAKLCDLQYPFGHASEAVASASMADDTDWQTLTLNYTPTVDKQLVLRVGGMNATGTLYWAWAWPDPTLPAAANVWTGTGTYGYAGGLLTLTKVASSIANCSAGNVKKDVVIDDVTGTYGGGGGGSPLLINGGLISTR